MEAIGGAGQDNELRAEQALIAAAEALQDPNHDRDDVLQDLSIAMGLGYKDAGHVIARLERDLGSPGMTFYSAVRALVPELAPRMRR